MTRTGWAVILGLSIVACGEPTTASAPQDSAGSTGVDTDEPGGSSTGVPEPVPLDVEAMVYTATVAGSGPTEVWFREPGAEPSLIATLEDEVSQRLCVNPDGRGYVLWGPSLGPFQAEEFAIDANGGTTDVQPLFPADLRPMGCAMGWTQEGFYVNVTSEQAAGPERVDAPSWISLDGTAVPVVGAEAAWEAVGTLAIERRPVEPSANTFAEVVLWDLAPSRPVQIASWATDAGVTARIVGPWLTLVEGDAPDVLTLVSLVEPTQTPVLLTPAGDRGEVRALSSPSGEFVALIDAEVDQAWIEMFHILDGEVVRQLEPAALPGVSWATRIGDDGLIVESGLDGKVVWALPLGEPARVIDRALPLDDHTVVAGLHVPSLDAALVLRRGGGTTQTWTFHPLHGGPPRPLPGADECEFDLVDDTIAAFHCRDGSSLFLDLGEANPQARSLDGLAPLPGLNGAGAEMVSWNGQTWWEVFFHSSETGYVKALFNPRTEESISLFHPDRIVGKPVFLPAHPPA